MNRLALVSLLALTGCHRGPDAVRVRVQLAPQQVATCVELQVLSNDGKLLDTQRFARPEGQQELRVALFQGELPDDVQLWARALWGSTGCDGPLSFNGQSELQATRFGESWIESLTVVLDPPSPAQDADQDGFAAHDLGGPDCDDQDARVHPGVHELCLDARADLNCDGHHGCDDATCAGGACTPVPTALVFATEVNPVGVGECAGPFTLQLLDSQKNPFAPASATSVQLEGASLEGLGFYADAKCLTRLNAPFIPAKESRLGFYVLGTQVGSGTLSASTLGLFATSVLSVK